MVQVRTAGYGFTKNTGNYESYRVYLEGTLDEGEDYLDAIANLKIMCEHDLSGYSIKSYTEKLEDLKRQLKVLKERINRYSSVLNSTDELLSNSESLNKRELLDMRVKMHQIQELDDIPF